MTRARPLRAPLACLLASVSLFGPLAAAARPPPEIRSADGLGHLALVGSAERSLLWVVGLYEVALYLPPGAPVDAVWREELPKAFRIRVLYGGSMPRQIPSDWREELVPALSDRQMRELTHAFRDLASGDIVWVHHRPDDGTRISVNRQLVVDDPGSGTIEAFARQWLGPDPVSEQIRDELRDGD